MPGTVESMLCVLSHLILTTPLRAGCIINPYFTKDETDTLKDKITFLRSQQPQSGRLRTETQSA